MFTNVGLEPQGACSVARPRPTLCDPMDWSPPDSSVQGILQARALEQVDMSSSRGSSQPRNRTQYLHCRQILYQLSYEGSIKKSTNNKR